jgi:hypothetical protein
MDFSRRSLIAAGSALAAMFLPSKAKAETLKEQFEDKERRLEKLSRPSPAQVTCNPVYDLVLTFAPVDTKAGETINQVCTDGTNKPIGTAMTDAKEGEPCFVAVGMFLK